jgi:hypothetical protein
MDGENSPAAEDAGGKLLDGLGNDDGVFLLAARRM